MKRGSLSLGMGEEGWVRNNRSGGAFGQFHTFGKKRPPVYLVLLEAPRGPLGKPELVGVHTIHTRPLPGWSLHSEGSSWCRAAPCLCSDPILSLKAGARALCTPPLLRAALAPLAPPLRSGTGLRSSQVCTTAPALLPTRTSPQGSPPEFPLWHLPAFDPVGAQTPSALLLPGPCNSFSFCCQNSVSVCVLGPHSISERAVSEMEAHSFTALPGAGSQQANALKTVS